MISGGIVMSTNMFGVPVEGFAQKSKEANNGVVYCSGTCKKKAGG